MISRIVEYESKYCFLDIFYSLQVNVLDSICMLFSNAYISSGSYKFLSVLNVFGWLEFSIILKIN